MRSHKIRGSGNLVPRVFVPLDQRVKVKGNEDSRNEIEALVTRKYEQGTRGTVRGTRDTVRDVRDVRDVQAIR